MKAVARSLLLTACAILGLCSFAAATPVEVLFPAQQIRNGESLRSVVLRCGVLSSAATLDKQDAATIPCTAAAKSWVAKTWAKTDLSPDRPLLLNQLSTNDPDTRPPAACEANFGELKINIFPGSLLQNWERTARALRFSCGETILTLINNKLYVNCRSAGELAATDEISIDRTELSVNGRPRSLLASQSKSCLDFSFANVLRTSLLGHPVLIAPAPTDIQQSLNTISWSGHKLEVHDEVASLDSKQRLALKARETIHVYRPLSEPDLKLKIEPICSTCDSSTPEQTDSLLWQDRQVLIFPKSFVDIQMEGSELRVGAKKFSLLGSTFTFEDGSKVALKPTESIVLDYGSAYLRGSTEANVKSSHEHHH